jgi:hypothetical protein
VILVGALEHLHDLLHDLGLHALGLLELLAVAVDDSRGSLADTEVGLVWCVSYRCRHQYVRRAHPRVGLLADVDLVRRGGAGELLRVPGAELETLSHVNNVNMTYSSAWAEGEPS